MFPLADLTILLLAMIAIAACMALFVTAKGWFGAKSGALVLGIGFLWPWPFVFALGPNGYLASAALLWGGWTTAALVAGLLWGLLARRIPGSFGIVSLVAVLPSLVAAAYVLERQRVPGAACALEAPFRIGDLDLVVPRRVGLVSFAAKEAPVQDWEGTYSDRPSAKQDVRALCRAISAGHAPIEVGHIWFSFGSFRRDLDADCDSATAPHSLQPACDAQARTQLTVVQFYARPDGIAAPSRSHFNSKLVNEARAAGERDGYRCQDSTVGPRLRYCTVWRQLSPEVVAVATAKLGPAQHGEDPLADSITLLAAWIGRLRVD